MVYHEIVALERRNRDWRRVQYEDQVRNNPLDYDSWLAYISLEHGAAANKHRMRELYGRATANVPPPPAPERDGKRYWRRYVDLWIKYGRYEEAGGGDAARQVYRQCLDLIPHHKFSFGKVWLLAATFELRQRNLKGARNILRTGIGKAPKPKIFRYYIEMERKLGNVNRCRKLYEKCLTRFPHNWLAWVKYAELETELGETERVRGLFQLGIAQQRWMRPPEMVWKAYIAFEISQGEFDTTRQLYERFVEWCRDLSVWISYARFEAQTNHSIQHARKVFNRAADYFGAVGTKEEISKVQQAWLNVEASVGDLGDVSLVKLSKVTRKCKFDIFNNVYESEEED